MRITARPAPVTSGEQHSLLASAIIGRFSEFLIDKLARAGFVLVALHALGEISAEGLLNAEARLVATSSARFKLGSVAHRQTAEHLL